MNSETILYCGGLVRGIDTKFSSGSVGDFGFTRGSCLTLASGLCVSASAAPGDSGELFSANPADAGSWTVSAASQGMVSVPALSEWGMILLAVSILILGGSTLRRLSVRRKC